MAATAPTTVNELIELLYKSQLVDPARVQDYWQRCQAAGDPPDDPRRLGRLLIEDGLLTHFQLEQLLRGKYKGFDLGNYRILERIGKGGMGTVYLAEHAHMRHRVAIKVLPPEHAENPALLERFYREARSAGLLAHPNIVRANDIDRDGELHYLVMEYVEGVTLHELVSQRGPLSIERAANYMAQTAAGLHYAHRAAGLVHRDIKPGNLLLDRQGTVKILDLGLARLGQVAFLDGDDDQITRKFNDRSILGTADYIAPEQALDSQSADTRADLYSLGATFYFLLTGQPPFPTGSATQKLIWHQMREPTPIRELRPEVPAEIAQLIRRMMAKKPADRPRDPGEVVEELRPWLEAYLPPPSAEEIPRRCPAAQGPSSGMTASMSSVNLAGPWQRGRASAETPAPNATAGSLSRPPDQAERNPLDIPLEAEILAPAAAPAVDAGGLLPKRPRARRVWLTALAILLLSGAAAAILRWQVIASEPSRPAPTRQR